MDKKGYNDDRKKEMKNKPNSDVQYVTLPYDFIPFPDEWQNYEGEGELEYGLHRHDQRNFYSGVIHYKLKPQSELAVELKEGKKNHFFVSGSSIRGRVRNNLEILSYSYPDFIDRTPMVYRDFTSKYLKESYKERMGISDGIEKSIRVGFLRKEGNDYYVVPAQQFPNGKYFLSIREHELVKKDFNGGGSFTWLFERGLSKASFERMNGLQDTINEMNKAINVLKEQLKGQLEQLLGEKLKMQLGLEKESPSIADGISAIFRRYSFINREDYNKLCKEVKKTCEKGKQAYSSGFVENKELLSIVIKLKSDLEELMPTKNMIAETYVNKLVERWHLKACIDLEYHCLIKVGSNRCFKPYQNQVHYKLNASNGIDKIVMPATQNNEDYQVGYLFNSTNVSSKRSHYFTMKPITDEHSYPILTELVQSYKNNFDKIRFPGKRNEDELKKHYNIFDNKNILEGHDGHIVFFKLDKDNKVNQIGRTPYFKITYNNSLEKILMKGVEEEKGISYADAIFGFTNDKLSYKSRVRFSPLEIRGEFDFQRDYKNEVLLLPSPSASANAMYIKQQDGKKGVNRLATYEDELKDLELNGYKYYPITTKIQESKKEPVNMISARGILHANKENLLLEGKIYFHNLTQEELGLLIISLDVKEVVGSKSYNIEALKVLNSQGVYEQIGGAKPYGYGKVKVEISSLHLEKKDCSFDSLILNPLDDESNRKKFVDAYLNKFGEIYREKFSNHLANYCESKVEEENLKADNMENRNLQPIKVSWFDIAEKAGNNGGGYPKQWRLKKRIEF